MPGRPRRSPNRLRLLYAAEASGSVAGALFMAGLPFYTHYRFGWGARENLSLSACQGIVYSLGALSAQSVARRLGRRHGLMLSYVLMTLMAAAISAAATWRLTTPFVLLVLGITTVTAVTWPMLESLVSSGADAEELSRRLGSYNVTWATVGALTLASCGAVIEYAPAWVFLALSGVAYVTSLSLIRCVRSEEGSEGASNGDAASRWVVVASPELAKQRRQALWLSRISLPATYVVIYSLVPMLPSLPAMHRLSPTAATVVASVWLAARAGTFVVTRRTMFWHSRPGLLFYATIVMLVSFVAIVVPAAASGLSMGTAVALMIPAQLALGGALGIIYAGSLYFGMVLSQGSTEHGGYHEALIGFGQTLGPGLAGVVLWTRPGDLWASAAAVTGIVGASVLAAAAARIERLWRSASKS